MKKKIIKGTKAGTLAGAAIGAGIIIPKLIKRVDPAFDSLEGKELFKKANELLKEGKKKFNKWPRELSGYVANNPSKFNTISGAPSSLIGKLPGGSQIKTIDPALVKRRLGEYNKELEKHIQSAKAENKQGKQLRPLKLRMTEMDKMLNTLQAVQPTVTARLVSGLVQLITGK